MVRYRVLIFLPLVFLACIAVDEASDLTSPQWVKDYPRLISVSETEALIAIKLDQDANVFWLVSEDSTRPGPHEIASESIAAQGIEGRTEATLTISNLSPGVSQTVWLIARGSGGQLQQIPAGVRVFTRSLTLVALPDLSYEMGYPGLDSDAIPVHTVSLRTFKIGKHEVTYELWTNLTTWASTNGYRFKNPGSLGPGGGIKSPVVEISWFDALAWCNAISEREGKTPCYYTTAARVSVYRDSSVEAFLYSADWVDWDANGYRLPTEAEWEAAARYINGTAWHPGNLASGASEGQHGAYAVYGQNSGGQIATVGSKSPNQLGIYDLSGNVDEWCFDLYQEDYYKASPLDNPRGPESTDPLGGNYRVFRGGSWETFYGDAETDLSVIKTSFRNAYEPDDLDHSRGFRVVCR